MRLALRWTVRLRMPGSGTEVQAETRNISSEGFYCISPESVTPGGTLDCAIGIPSPSSPDRQHYVHCRCTVLRIERISDELLGELFGVACHIDDYSVSPDQIQ